jgi:hypothetical protein
VIVAVDGRSAGGKTTTSGRIAATVPGATVVHTDDVAWYESFFGWAHLLRDGVLDPARRGVERDGDDEAGVAFREEWDAQEVPFLAADRPWERAAGGAALPYDPAAERVVADRMMSR